MRKKEVDYKTWLTKTEAAQALNCNTKTIEREAARGRIQQAWRRVPKKRPVAIFNPEDVARMQQLKPAFPMPTAEEAAEADQLPVGSKAVAAAARTDSPAEFVRELALALRPPGHRLADRLFLTVAEAAEYSGLGPVYLRRLIAEGKLRVEKGAGAVGADVVRKADLAGL